FSHQISAELTRRVIRSKTSRTRRLNSISFSTMIGHIVHSNRSQTVSIESKCGDPDGEENQIDPELLGMLARVFTSIRTVLVRDEQNSLTGILLADQLRYLTNLRF